MFECFEKIAPQIEKSEANTKGVTVEEIHKQNMQNAQKIVVRILMILSTNFRVYVFF